MNVEGVMMLLLKKKKKKNPATLSPQIKRSFLQPSPFFQEKQLLELFYSNCLALHLNAFWQDLLSQSKSPVSWALNRQNRKVVLSPESFPSRPIEDIVPPQEIPCFLCAIPLFWAQK